MAGWGDGLRRWAGRPLGRVATAVTALVLSLGPFSLQYDPFARIFRNPLTYYRLHSDDFAYVAASRDLARASENLWAPHNTHVVPAWRVLTWGLVAAAGRLESVPPVLAVAAYFAVVATMLLAGRFVARETGRATLGLAATVAAGTTSLLTPAVTWYSAGQTLWASSAVLLTLLFAQGWRARGGAWRLASVAASAWLAGAFWTVGHVAGPVAAVYLWADGRPRARRAAAIPLAATAVSVALALAAGARKIDSQFSFGRSTREAIAPTGGALHALHAVAEKLVLGNLGVLAETSAAQAVALCFALGWAWVLTRRNASPRVGPTRPERAAALAGAVGLAGLAWLVVDPTARPALAVAGWGVLLFLGGVTLADRASPLERAGAAVVLGSYFAEMVFRGYLDYDDFREVRHWTDTRSESFAWYETIPHVGFVLFLAGWWSATRGAGASPATRGGALGAFALLVVLLAVHRPRADAQVELTVPRLTDTERVRFAAPELRRLRALYLAADRADWQRRHLAKLDRAEAVARREGLGRRQIKALFGRVDAPELPSVYRAEDLLALPRDGPNAEPDPSAARQALGPLFAVEPPPRPLWVRPGEPWPAPEPNVTR